MEQEFSNVAPAKKNNTVLIVVAVIAALLCCCCILIVGGLTLLGPTVSDTFENIEEGIEQGAPYEMPAEGEDPSYEGGEGQGEETYPGLSDYVPVGGLGDEILRTDTWLNVTFSAVMASCTIPADGAQNTSIEVIQNPDGAGVWVERWTVPCDEGSSKAFDITFTPAASGGTDISIQTAE
ncbi:MAG: hypothetical protein CVU44_03635 [Chloroflexi bacterium HGW-Chloroflexi-6]|nr:MAG: hypothetical protein CVU44_03635 [Chloroflexi bacterium HGW-Chloroflexi-6]